MRPFLSAADHPTDPVSGIQEEGFRLKNDKQPNKNGGGNRRVMGIVNIVVWALILLAGFNWLFSSMSLSGSVEVKFSDFIQLVKEDKVDSVKLQNNRYSITLKEDKQKAWLAEYYAEDKSVDPDKAEMPDLYTAPISYPDFALLLEEHSVTYYTP